MKRRTIGRVFLLLLLAALAGVAWPATARWRFRSAVTDDARAAGRVILERYDDGNEVLQSAEVPVEEFVRSVRELPLAGGFYPANSACWRPQHRIRFGGAGAAGTVEICFACDEILTEKMGRREIPEEWLKPLREIFTARGISVGDRGRVDVLKLLDEVDGTATGGDSGDQPGK